LKEREEKIMEVLRLTNHPDAYRIISSRKKSLSVQHIGAIVGST